MTPLLPANWVDLVQEFHASNQNDVENAVNGLCALSTKTANYTATLADRYIELDATTGPITAQLPSAVGCAGKAFTFIRSDTVTTLNLVTIAAASGETIDGVPTQVLVFQGHWLSVLSDGTRWLMIGNSYKEAELGTATLLYSNTTTNTLTSDSVLAATKIQGLSVTTMGAGRVAVVEFNGQVYNTTANTSTGATLLINGAQANGDAAAVSGPYTPSPSDYRKVRLKARKFLTAGTQYTFEVAMWVAGGLGSYVASDNPLAPYSLNLAVIGQ